MLQKDLKRRVIKIYLGKFCKIKFNIPIDYINSEILKNENVKFYTFAVSKYFNLNMFIQKIINIILISLFSLFQIFIWKS